MEILSGEWLPVLVWSIWSLRDVHVLENQDRKDPRGVVGFFQVKENGKNVFFLGKNITNETVKSYQLICSATFFSENRTAPRPINLWIPRPTSIAYSQSVYLQRFDKQLVKAMGL